MTRRNLKIAVRALRSLCRYPLRSLLMMLSASLGVAGVVCSVNYGAGGSKQILDQIRRMGTNVVIITPVQSRAIGGRARTGGAVVTLVEQDYAAIRKEVPTRVRSSAIVSQGFRVKAGDLSKSTTVFGCEPEYFMIKDWPVLNGAAFDASHERSVARVALLGHTVAADLFGSSSPIGQRLMINRVPFVVIGVLSERGQGLDVSNEDDEVYVPLTTAMRRLMNSDHFSAIVVEINALSSMNAASAQLQSLLRTQHRIHGAEKEDFQIQNQKTLLDTQIAASDRLKFFLRWIAASALVVSGLGIAVITWIAVRERTREIGTRRALGATGGDIFFEITVETAALALTGSISGVAVSWPVSRIISSSVGLPFVFQRETALLSFLAAVTLDLIFTLYSSRKAASVHPMEALRYE